MIGREKCILLTMISNVHDMKSFFFTSYRPNSPNTILGLWSSIIVKMMDEHSDLPAPIELCPILFPTSYCRTNHYQSRLFFFHFQIGLFAVLTHCVRQKTWGLFPPIIHTFGLSVLFFTENSLLMQIRECGVYKSILLF